MKRGSGWHGESRRHYLASMGVASRGIKSQFMGHPKMGGQQYNMDNIWSPKPMWAEDVALAKITEHRDPGMTDPLATTFASKDVQLIGTFADMKKIGREFEIVNALDPSMVVRRIKFTNGSMLLDAMDGSGFLRFPVDTPVFYEQWAMDRGSYLFYMDDDMAKQVGQDRGFWAKLSTEYDPVQAVVGW